jgi:uncharacterized protein DUF6152
MKHRFLVVSSTIGLALLASSAAPLAHHSVSATYIFGKTVRIEGTLKEFVWRNPHSFMRVEAPDDKGVKYIWIIEGAAPQQLSDAGLTASTLRPGDHVVVIGRPGRIAEDHKLLLHIIERPSDGFKYEGPNNPQ